jgi:hypothetical protein
MLFDMSIADQSELVNTLYKIQQTVEQNGGHSTNG